MAQMLLPASRKQKGEQSKLLCSVVSLFLSCFTPLMPRADLWDSGLFLAVLLGELESDLLPGVYLSICFLTRLLVH